MRAVRRLVIGYPLQPKTFLASISATNRRHSIVMTVEGELAPAIVKSLASGLREKLAEVLENTSIDLKPLS